MADAVHHELIIVKRHEEEEHEHHSSAWKVAHADFMTAMMAFFLIMWLINVTDDQIRKGISQYFNPIRLSEGQTDMKGLNKPDPSQEQSRGKKGHSEEAAKAFNPLKLSQGHSEAKELENDSAAASAAAAAEAEAPAEHAGDKGQEGEESHEGAAAPAPVAAPAGPNPTESTVDTKDREHAAFQDPYAVLAKLAEQYSVAHALSIDSIEADARPPGVAGGEVDRDPFDPVYWQLAPTPPALVDQPGEPGSAEMTAVDALPDAAAMANDVPADPAIEPPAAPVPSPAVEGAAEITKRAALPPEQAPSIKDAEKDKAAIDAKIVSASESLDVKISEAVKAAMGAEESPQLSVKATKEGVLIDLTDDADFSMFEIGSAIPNGKVVVLMEKIAKVLAESPGVVVVRGFTDGRPFRSSTYDNWRLSAARAHMAYYMLARGGLDEKRVAAIEGYADRSLLNPADPNAAENRRIEILLKEVE